MMKSLELATRHGHIWLNRKTSWIQPSKEYFFNGVREFYKAVSTTIIKKFTFKDHVIDDVAFLLPDKRGSVTTASVDRLAGRFSAAVPQEALDALEEEILDYILLPPSALPSTQEEGKPVSNEDLCAYWQQIGRMTNPDSSIRFPNLSRLAKCLLSLPVSNAETERVFSILRKVLTEYRTQIDQSTLCALVSFKLNCDSKCFELETLAKFLEEARTTTMNYNKAHSSKHKE